MNDRLRGWWRQLRVLVHKDAVERELDEEMAFHLRMETERRVRDGMSRPEARRAARLAFGGVERSKEGVRDARWIRPVENFLADLRYGLRSLHARPGFATAAILVLALGIGGTTAVFSVVRRVLLEPLPYERPGQLVRLYQVDDEAPDTDLFVSAPHFLEYRQRASAFESLATVYTFHEVGMDLSLGSGGGGSDETRRIVALPVSSGYLSLLRQPILRGREFEPADETGKRLAMVSESLWREIGLQRDGLGASIELDGEAYTVIGVVPGGFTGPLDPSGGRVEAWVPQNLTVGGLAEDPGNHWLTVLGRLAPDVSIEAAREEMAALDAALAETWPESADDGGFRLVPLQEDLVADARPALLVVLGAVVLVLLVACVNLASLLLVRSLGRRREVAVRSALGAEPRRITTQVLIEGAVIATAGGLAGLAVALGGIEAVRRLGRDAVPRAAEIAVDGPMLGTAAVLALATSLAAGLLPAWRLARTAPSAALGESSRTTTADRGSRRLRRLLVAGQVGLALTLLVGASALGASVYRLTRVELGVRTDGVLTFQLNLPPARYEPETRAATHRRAMEAIAALPGIESVGATTVLPAIGTFYEWGTRARTGPLAGEEEPVGAEQRVVAGRYFKTLGIPIVAGRALDDRDRPGDGEDDPAAAVVSASLAARLFPGVPALGQTIVTADRERRIVGVAADAALDSTGAPAHFVYHWSAQFESRPPALEYLVASSGDPEALVPALRAAVAAVDPRLVVHRPVRLEDVVRRGWSDRRFAFALTGCFALLALVLAAVGLYGVLAYEVRQRRREIGIRLAMGAAPARVAARVVREGLTLTAIGVGVGAIGAFALGRFLSALVFATNPTEPLVLAAAGGALLATAVAASLLPAWQALRTPPRVSLLEP